MKNKILLGVGVVVILILTVLTGCSANTESKQPITVNTVSQQTGIWVTGEGKVTVTPNIATLNVGVYVQSDKVADAQNQASTAMDKVIAALTENGIDKKDIQTQNFSIQQVSKWDDKTQQQIIIGYSVSNMVVTKIRTLDKVGTIVDAAVVAGGDLIRINGIDFSVEDPSDYYVQARDLAMQKAKAKADQIAKDSGVTLDKPTYISENNYYPAPYITNSFKSDMASGAAVPTTSINPGQLEITLDVQVAYGIK
jgi:uncharacterized protein